LDIKESEQPKLDIKESTEEETNNDFVTKVLFIFILKKFGHHTLFTIKEVKQIIEDCKVEELNSSDFKATYIFRQSVGKKIKIGLREECSLEISGKHSDGLDLYCIRSA
jgi:hypothetical protein